ncbi:MAG: hypothetical protein KFH98_09940 [Gemmatimonadetes bacterium]|nr:hypothetical protein [Gemmatimonadota bacterium]
MRYAALLLLTSFIAACGPPALPQDSTRATIEVMAAIRPGTPLEEMLERLDQHLVNAMSGQLDGSAGEEFLLAEALSDRLLEARMPFEWIPSEGYSLESKLRQIQSSADRILAQLRTSAPRQQTLQDLRNLRTEVARLRQTVAAGGAPAPVPIGRLLSGDTANTTAAAPLTPSASPDVSTPASAAPLGTPVPGGNP